MSAKVVDRLILGFDSGLRLFSAALAERSSCVGEEIDLTPLSRVDRARVSALMRVNHAGEVCAQALYHGQAIGARRGDLANQLRESAREEADHLEWTARRIEELQGRVSVLNPLWFAGSMAIGVGVALVGDRWSLAFLRETELQVVAHLDRHLELLPTGDAKTRHILLRMRTDELRHALVARELGGRELPFLAVNAMRACAAVMTGVSRYV